MRPAPPDTNGETPLGLPPPKRMLNISVVMFSLPSRSPKGSSSSPKKFGA